MWPYEMSRIWGQMIYTFMKDRESLMILEEVCVAIHCFLFYHWFEMFDSDLTAKTLEGQ